MARKPGLEREMGELKTEVKGIAQDMSEVKTEVKAIGADLSRIVQNLDKRITDLEGSKSRMVSALKWAGGVASGVAVIAIALFLGLK